jgi:hypothetical protein
LEVDSLASDFKFNFPACGKSHHAVVLRFECTRFRSTTLIDVSDVSDVAKVGNKKNKDSPKPPVVSKSDIRTDWVRRVDWSSGSIVTPIRSHSIH